MAEKEEVRNDLGEQGQEVSTTDTTINDFLAQNVAKKEEKEVTFDRFKSPFKIKALTSEELNAIRDNCSTKKKDRRTGQIVTNTNQKRFVSQMVINAVTYPDLNNEALQRSYGVVADPQGLLDKMFLAGEYADLVEAVQEESGFDSMEELVGQAKK